jgi:hypothetical protein
VPNKANSPGGAGLSCTNKPNLPSGAVVRCTNKPNLGWPGWCLQGNSAEQSQFRRRPGVPKAKCAKQSQTWAPWGIRAAVGRSPGWSRLCKTNPIYRGSPQRHRDRRGGSGLLQRHALDFILRGLRVSVASIRAKQSQCPATPGGPRPGGGRPECCTNKPNSCAHADPEIGAPGREDCAKQTQFQEV